MAEHGASENDTALMVQFIDDMGDVITRWGATESKKGNLVGIPELDEDGNPKDEHKMAT